MIDLLIFSLLRWMRLIVTDVFDSLLFYTETSDTMGLLDTLPHFKTERNDFAAVVGHFLLDQYFDTFDTMYLIPLSLLTGRCNST